MFWGLKKTSMSKTDILWYVSKLCFYPGGKWHYPWAYTAEGDFLPDLPIDITYERIFAVIGTADMEYVRKCIDIHFG